MRVSLVNNTRDLIISVCNGIFWGKKHHGSCSHVCPPCALVWTWRRWCLGVYHIIHYNIFMIHTLVSSSTWSSGTTIFFVKVMDFTVILSMTLWCKFRGFCWTMWMTINSLGWTATTARLMVVFSRALIVIQLLNNKFENSLSPQNFCFSPFSSL